MSVAINRAFLLKTRTGPTETVDSGEAYFWLEGTSIKYKDDTQTTKTLATGVTSEDVQDIVGTFITSGNSRITAVYNDAGNTFVITLIEANIVHQNLSGAGTNTHAQIDSHISNTSNPHATTAVQVGADPTGSASAAQAFAIQRTNHTGSQLASTISDLTEAVQDVVGGFILAGTGISVSYNDAGNSFTITSSITQYTDELAQDAAALMITSATHTGISVSYNDAGNSLAFTNTDRGSTAVTSHEAALDPHPQYLTLTEGNAAYDALGAASTAQAFAIQRANHTGSQLASTISDFNEAAQDAIGGILTDSASIDFTYNDAGNTLTAVVLPAGVNHDLLQNFVANEHINHSTVSISAGTGLTGGGDITANRTLNLANTAVTPGTYGASGVPQFTVDAQGRITAASNGPALVIGDNFENFLDDTLFTTTSNANQVAASFPTTSKQVGNYRIGMYWVYRHNATNNSPIFGLYVDGVLIGEEFMMEHSDAATNERLSFSMFEYVNFATQTTHTIELRARSENNGTSLSVYRVVAEIWRVS